MRKISAPPSKTFSAKPHNIGSAGSREYAELIESKLKSYGFDAKIETYTVLFPTPVTRVLEMTTPNSYKALLKEQVLKEDATSGQKGQLPVYNAWSADGDVSGEVVFVNYGLPQDYEELGDPLTPGIGATQNAHRIASHTEAPNLLKIPVLPISYHDAKPLLAALEGPVATAEWRGALPITYHIPRFPGTGISALTLLI